MRILVEWNFSKLASLMLILVVFLVVLLFLIKFGIVFKSKAEREICRNSVLAQSVIMYAPGGENVVQPDCKTYEVRFFEDHTEINGKTVEVFDLRKKDFVKNYNGLTDDIVNRVVAEELRGCWYEFLEGNKSLFSLGLIFAGGNHNCYLCSEISFDYSVKKKQFSGFYDFLKNTPMKNSNITYYKYIAEASRLSSLWHSPDPGNNSWEKYAAGFSGWLGSGTQIKLGKCGNLIDFAVGEKRGPIQTDITFEKSQLYTVFFVREGESSRVRKLAGEGQDPDCNDETYFAYVIPSTDLSVQCDVLARGLSQ